MVVWMTHPLFVKGVVGLLFTFCFNNINSRFYCYSYQKLTLTENIHSAST